MSGKPVDVGPVGWAVGVTDEDMAAGRQVPLISEGNCPCWGTWPPIGTRHPSAIAPPVSRGPAPWPYDQTESGQLPQLGFSLVWPLRSLPPNESRARDGCRSSAAPSPPHCAIRPP